MKIIKTSNTYSIFSGESLEVHDTVPVGTYQVDYNLLKGLHLKKIQDLVAGEEKVYGESTKKVDKIMAAWPLMNRNLGILLSGGKGHGKSLMMRQLSERARAIGLPIILINTPYNGLVDFLNSIEQEVVFAFDEFEKVFPKNLDEKDSGDDTAQAQSPLLSLFDGTSSNKRMFIATINDLWDLSSFFKNRPGRFHYHIRFTSPKFDEIKEYLQDNMVQRQDEIDVIADFLSTISSSFDILRAIVFELNLRDDSFEEILKDLNIMSSETPMFEVLFYFKDNKTGHSFVKEQHLQLALWRNLPSISVNLNFKEESMSNVNDWVYLDVDFNKKTRAKNGAFEIPGSAASILDDDDKKRYSVEKITVLPQDNSHSFFFHKDAL